MQNCVAMQSASESHVVTLAFAKSAHATVLSETRYAHLPEKPVSPHEPQLVQTALPHGPKSGLVVVVGNPEVEVVEGPVVLVVVEACWKTTTGSS
jgi:hypothetical protein